MCGENFFVRPESMRPLDFVARASAFCQEAGCRANGGGDGFGVSTT